MKFQNTYGVRKSINYYCAQANNCFPTSGNKAATKKKWLEDKILEDQNHNYIIATHHCPLVQCLDRSYHNFVPNYFATDQTNIINNTLLSYDIKPSSIVKKMSYQKFL